MKPTNQSKQQQLKLSKNPNVNSTASERGGSKKNQQQHNNFQPNLISPYLANYGSQMAPPMAFMDPSYAYYQMQMNSYAYPPPPYGPYGGGYPGMSPFPGMYGAPMSARGGLNDDQQSIQSYHYGDTKQQFFHANRAQSITGQTTDQNQNFKLEPQNHLDLNSKFIKIISMFFNKLLKIKLTIKNRSSLVMLMVI
jgi:hypothetical protein